jgi:hypothetical protein
MSDATARMEFIEVKDYMAQWGRKATGWTAIKSVFRWWDTMIEVQVQPSPTFHREREALTAESHGASKRGAKRSAIRLPTACRLPVLSRSAPLAVSVARRARSHLRRGRHRHHRLNDATFLSDPSGKSFKRVGP